MPIRNLLEKEVPELLELYAHYTSEENLPELTEEKINAIWKQIESNPSVNYFVLEADNKIIASCILSITPSFIRGGDGYAMIEHVVTHSDYRRRGYGKAIVNYALNYAWDNGCTEVMLLSGTQNEKAHLMYENIGFDKYRKKGFIIYKNKKEYGQTRIGSRIEKR